MTTPQSAAPADQGAPVPTSTGTGRARRSSDYRMGYEAGYKAGREGRRGPASHVNIRHTPEGFEARCRTCSEWWPVSVEFWQVKNGMARCKACWRLYKKLHERERSLDEFYREAKRQANRVRYWTNREANLEAQRAWRAANRERIAAYNRAYRARNPEHSRAQVRAYYAEARDVILLKKRAKYAAEKAA